MQAFINYLIAIIIYCQVDFILNYSKLINSIKLNYHLNLIILNFLIKFNLIYC